MTTVWYNSLKDNITELNASGIAVEDFDGTLNTFHTRVTNQFITFLTENINNRFADCQELLVAFSIFDYRHLPAESDPGYREYGKDKLARLSQQYGVQSHTTNNGNVVKFDPDIDSEQVVEEWMTYRRLLSTQKGDTQESIQEVIESPVYRQMFPNIVKLMSIFLCLPVSTASVERSFSSMKTIKTRLRNRLTDASLMLIAIEGPDELSDSNLNNIVDTWSVRAIPV